jgi:hypothetical protein
MTKKQRVPNATEKCWAESEEKYIAGHPVRDNVGRTCCDMRLCTHEFYEHQEVDIPWWACVEENCEEHQEMKIQNQLSYSQNYREAQSSKLNSVRVLGINTYATLVNYTRFTKTCLCHLENWR